MDKCSICFKTKYEMVFSSTCEHCICDGCLPKEIFFNYGQFMKVENPNEEITMKCVICNIGEFLLTKNTIYQVLSSLKIIKEDSPNCGKCPEGLNFKVILFCSNCKIFLCQNCFTNHPSEHTLTKNLNVKTNNILCTLHSEQTLMFECKTCSMPICLICEKIGHQGHQLSYIKDAFRDKKEKIYKQLPFSTFEKFNTHLQEEKIKILDDLKRKSKEFTDNIESLISELHEIIFSFKNKITLFEENFKISTYNLQILFERFYEDISNTSEEDYFNLNILSKLPDDYGKINLNQSFNLDNFSISPALNNKLLNLKDELKIMKDISFTSNSNMTMSSQINHSNENKNDIVHSTPDVQNSNINVINSFYNPNYEKISSIEFNDNISALLQIDDNLILGTSFKNLFLFEITSDYSFKLIKNISYKKNLLNPPALLLLDDNIVYGGDKLEIYYLNLNIVEEIHLNEQLNEKHISSLCRISEKSFAAGFSNGCIKIFTKNTSNQKFSEEICLTSHINEVTSLLCLENKNILLSGSLGEIKIWNLSQQTTLMQTLIGHKSFVNSLISLNDEMFASSCRDIKIWSIKDNFNCVKTINAHWDTLNSLKLLNSNYIITPSSDGKFKIWNAEEPYKCLRTYNESSGINFLLVMNNSTIVTSTKDNKINIWIPIS
jgi:hypothetical protein